MNVLAFTNAVNDVPDGFDLGNIKKRATSGLTVALALVVPIHAQADGSVLREYFIAQVEGYLPTLYAVNEAMPIPVDSIVENALHIWRKRQELAYSPRIHDVIKPTNPMLDEITTRLGTDLPFSGPFVLKCKQFLTGELA